jgi:hypothetical protein
MTKAARILLIAVSISLFFSLGITFPFLLNEDKTDKTIRGRIQEHYSESIHFGQSATKTAIGDEIPEGSLEAKLEIDHPPKIGETAHLTLTIISHWDFPEVRIEVGMGRLGNVDKEAGIQLISGIEEFEKIEERKGSSYHYLFFCSLGNGESKAFNFDVKVTNEGLKYIGGGVEQHARKNWDHWIGSSDGYYLRIEDSTCEISKDPFPAPPEYWVSPLMQGNGPFGSVKRMRKDMQKFMEAAPELSKWEARWLVDKAERHSIFPYEVDKSLTRIRKEWLKNETEKVHDVSDPLVLRSILVDEMIKMTKSSAMRERKELYEVLRDEIMEWKKSRPEEIFISPDEGGSLKTNEDRVDSVTVKGYFKFKKHQYDTTGLDTTTVDTPIRRAMIWVWENAPTPTYLGKCLTDSIGYFEKKVEAMGSGAHHVFVVVHTTGPNFMAPEAYKIKVISDTVEQFPSSPAEKYWRENTDPKIVYNGGTANFGEYFFGTRHGLYPDNPQPRSGAANIFNALLYGYEFLVDSLSLATPPYSLYAYAIWEEGYHSPGRWTSCYVGNDSIKICAGKQYGTGDQLNTDEWDDDVILHEFGHFLMHRFAELKIGGGCPDWAKWSTFLQEAWEEAWAYLFSSIVRNDPFFINTHKGIGKHGKRSYYNLEDENHFWYDSCPDSMEGGGGCIDAIAASLWDFRDATNESWPDGRQDRMTVSFEEIWDVFDNYDPYPLDTLKNHCLDIYDFWAGYVYGYNQASWVKEIFNHHKIGLNMVYVFSATGGNQKVDLDWRLKLYGQKERSTNIFYIYRSDWEFGPFGLVDSVDYVPPETLYSYSDTTVQYSMPYWYKLGVVDSAGLESETDVDSGIPYNLPSAPNAPAPVTNLNAFDTPYDQGGSITLTWTKSADDSIITDYYIFRTWYSGEGYYCIDSVGQGIETYTDMNTTDGDTCYYIVRAHNGVRGSNSSEVWAISQDNRVASADNQFATAFGKKLICSASGRIHLVWSSWDRINYIYSDNKGGYWSEIQDIGDGEYPSIALDSNDRANVVWMWYAPPMHIAQSILYFARNTGSAWTDPDTLWNYWANSGIPCFQIDDNDTGHVAWNSYAQFGPGKSVGTELNYGYFATQTASPTFNDTTIAEDPTDPGIEVPSLAIDSTYYESHVVYAKDRNIYYTRINKTTWTQPRRISDNSDSSEYPYIEYDEGSNKLHVVWQQKKGGNYQIMYVSAVPRGRWSVPIVACSTGYNSVNPVITCGEFILWSEEITNNSEIYYSRYSGGSWGSPALVKNTTEDSKYPHATHVPSADSDTVFVAWTDGDSAPYIIEFQGLNFAKQKRRFSGHITRNSEWSEDIIIYGDVCVDPGVTLTIKPGIQVKFVPNHDEEQGGMDPQKAEFIVEGNLRIMEDNSLPVVFTSNASRPKAGDWFGIRLVSMEKKKAEKRRIQPSLSEKSNLARRNDEERANNKNTKKMQNGKQVEKARIPQIICNLRIEHANIGLLVDRSSNLMIVKCKLINNRMGLKVAGDIYVDIIDCDFQDNIDCGISICSDAYGEIQKCKLVSNRTGMIFLRSDNRKKDDERKTSLFANDLSEIEAGFVISECTIAKNSEYGIYAMENAKLDLGSPGHNYIHGNGKYNFYNGTPSGINAKENYWGTMNVADCMEGIYDFFDDNSLGAVSINPLWNGNYESKGTMESGEGEGKLRNHLSAASPSLFLVSTTISYSIARSGYVSISIYDISGRLVRGLCNEKQSAGVHAITWNGCDNSNCKVSTGVYFIRMAANNFVDVKKVMIVR